MAQSLGDAPTHKWTKWDAGLVYADDLIEQKRANEAAMVLQKTLAFFSPAEKSSESYTDVLHRIGLVYAAQHKEEEAKRYFMAAYANYELSRANAPGDEGRAKLDLHHQRFINDFVDLYIRSKDFAAAVALLESNKARTLSDLMETPSQRQAYGRWREMESRHAKEISELFQPGDDALLPVRVMDLFSKAATLVKNQDEERRHLQSELNLKDITATRSVSKEEVQDLQRRLPSDMAALSFFVRSDKTAVFVLTSQGVRHIPLELDATELRRTVETLRLALTNPDNDFYREPAKALFTKLLAPALKALPTSVKIVLYSPDGIISRIPLTVLMDGDRFAGERYAFYSVSSLRYATSAATVKVSPAGIGVSCVDPQIQNARLPFQQEAGQELKKLYGEKMILLGGAACSESGLAAAIQQERAPFFLYVGAHGNFYPENAMESAVYLTAEEGDKSGARVWNAKAMAALDMSRLELVTLSSCESGLKDPKRARDVFGIARALFFAGAKQVIAPLWSVEDQSSAEFMHAFYAAYAEKQPAVLALQRAEQAMMKNPQYRHPYYWSAFVLTGATR
jgi:CHAT domain-containing protein